MNRFNSSTSLLVCQSKSLKQTYQTNQPSSHLVIDGLFESEVIELILQEFVKRDRYVDECQTVENLAVKTKPVQELSAFGRTLYFWLNSPDFIRPLSLIVDRERDSLLGDPYYYGAGIHELLPGENIESQHNSSLHGKLPLICQFNLIICLNTQNTPEWLGKMEISYTETKTTKTVNYSLRSNRTFILPMTNGAKYKVKTSDRSIYSSKFLSIYYWSLIPM